MIASGMSECALASRHRRVGGLVMAAWLGSSAWVAAASVNFIMASRGQPGAEIVVEERADPPVAFAARDLQRYVKAISGAELAVVNRPSGKPPILLVQPTSVPM